MFGVVLSTMQYPLAHRYITNSQKYISEVHFTFSLLQVLLMLPVRWDALKVSNLAHTVYKGGLLAHPNKGVKSLAESLCKQWTDAAPVKKPRYVSIAPGHMSNLDWTQNPCKNKLTPCMAHAEGTQKG